MINEPLTPSSSSSSSSSVMPTYDAVHDRDDDDDQSSPDRHAPGAVQTNSSSDGDLELRAKGPKDRSGAQRDDRVDFGNAFRRNCNSRIDGTPAPSNLHVVAPPNIQRARRLIYASHFVSQFSECAWQFAVVLFLAAVSNYHSILLVSSYYLTTYIAVMLFGSSIGAFLDRSDRLRAARLCIGIDGMPIEQVGLWRGLSSAIGLAGTFAYKFSARRTTVVNTGAWSIVYLFLWLTLVCASFFMNSTILLVVSAAISRIGLWVFDISYTLIYQQNVADGLRGLIGGTQQSLNSFFTMLSGCLGLFFNKPKQFWVIIATTGYACIAVW